MTSHDVVPATAKRRDPAPGPGLRTEAGAMQRALVLARRGLGHVRPNPPVGAVVLKNGAIVGSGFHARAGEPHAEIHALNAAGEASRGATLVVTLEPCNHQGRTGPCVSAIVEAGISRVVIALRDPHRVSGSGLEALAEAGIETRVGPGRRAAAHLVAGFISLVERGRPRMTVKVATSLDGRIASLEGDSRWISSPIARAWVHRRRREADAVVVGSGTALADDPALTTRAVSGRSADRMVLDSHLRLPPRARVWNEDGAARVAVTTEAASPEAIRALEDRGVKVWVLPADDAGQVDLDRFASRLGEEGYTNVLVEGGGRLAGSLLSRQLVDAAWMVMSRELLLGGGGPGWTEGLRVSSVRRAVRLARADLRSLGPDWLVTLVPEAAAWWDPETYDD